MFDGPEYESYIALCRELRLEHIFAREDLLAKRNFDRVFEVEVAGSAWVGLREESDAVWLPRLDQWLKLLEEAGEYEVTIISGPKTGSKRYSIGLKMCTDSGTDWDMVDAPSREEAAARLWMAVTGRKVGV